MKFSCETIVLRDKFRVVALGCSKSQNVHAKFRSVHIEADEDGQITMFATDNEVEVSLWITDKAEVERPGSFMVSRDFLERVLGACDGERVALSLDGDKLTVSSGRPKWTTTTETTPEEFDPDDVEASFEVDSSELSMAIRRTIYAAEPSPVITRYALSGLLFDWRDSSLFVVGYDGFRVAIQEAVADVSLPMPPTLQPIVPMRLVKLVASVLPKPNEPTAVKVSFVGDSSVVFEFGDVRISGRLAQGRYPDWRDYLRQYEERHIHSFKVGSQSLRRLFDQASAPLTGESRAIEFGTDGGLLLASAVAGGASSDASVEIDGQWKKVSILCRYDFARDPLASMGDVEVEAKMCGDALPAGYQIPGFTYMFNAMSREK